MSKEILLLAGAGDFPLLVATELKKNGYNVSVIAFNSETSKEIESYTTDIAWLEVGSFSKLFSVISSKNIKNLILAGKIDHRYLFTKKLDDAGTKFFSSLKDTRAETILLSLIEEFKKLGITVLPSTTGVEHLFAKEGILNGVEINTDEMRDIELGFKVAKGLSSFDVGQTVVVRNGTVVALEALEGTDETILRSGRLSGPGNVVVKVARPSQDLRFDLPVVGDKTVEVLIKTSARVLAIESGKTLVFNKESLFEKAAKNNISIYGIK